MRKSKCRLYTFVLSLISAAVFSIVDASDTFQMKSVFGLPPVAAAPEHVSIRQDHPAPSALPLRTGRPPFRAITYNLHSGFGSDWALFASRTEVKANLRSIARRIVESAPALSPVDVIGLNEVDFHSRRSGWIDQAAFLAEELSSLTGSMYHIVRGETWRRDVPGLEVQFGNALLTRHPIIDEHSCTLGSGCEEEPRPVIDTSGSVLSRFFGEKRGIVRARIDFHDQPVDVLVTHLEAFVMSQREVQAAEILRDYVHPGISTVLLGDMNTVPSDMTAARRLFAADRTHDILTSDRLLDARVSIAARTGVHNLSAWSTYPSGKPQWPLDGIFATSDLLPQDAQVVGGDESDHRGLLVSYRWLDDEGTAAYGRWHDAMKRHQLNRILRNDLHASKPGMDGRFDWLFSATAFGKMITESEEQPPAL